MIRPSTASRARFGTGTLAAECFRALRVLCALSYPKPCLNIQEEACEVLGIADLGHRVVTLRFLGLEKGNLSEGPWKGRVFTSRVRVALDHSTQHHLALYGFWGLGQGESGILAKESALDGWCKPRINLTDLGFRAHGSLRLYSRPA